MYVIQQLAADWSLEGFLRVYRNYWKKIKKIGLGQ